MINRIDDPSTGNNLNTMIPRILEPEVMDTLEEARDYDAMDHSHVNRIFTDDFLSFFGRTTGTILDVGTGTSQIPIEICQRQNDLKIVAIDLADEMLKLAMTNLKKSGLSERIEILKANGRSLNFPSGQFDAVISNSIIHHIPDSYPCFAEMIRVCKPGGHLFVRDLLRPDSTVELDRLVQLYAGDANEHQRKLFSDSLHAALTLNEVQSQIVQLGFPPNTVQQTSDRHWTWRAIAG